MAQEHYNSKSRDVTDEKVRSLTHSVRPPYLAKVQPVHGLTTARKRVMAQCDGMKMGYWANAVIWSREARKLSRSDHRILLALVLGGYFRILECPGSIYDDPANRAQTHHYVLVAKQ